MKIRASIGLVPAVALATAFLGGGVPTFAASMPSSMVIYVNAHAKAAVGQGTMSAPYATIQQAVAMARPGAMIMVAPGTYHGQVVLTKPLTVMAGASGKVVLNAQGATDGILITQSNSAVEGLTIEHADEDGILAVGKGPLSNLTISHNIVEDNDLKMTAALNNKGVTWESIHLMGVSHSYVLDNQDIDNKDGGIYLTDETGPNTNNIVEGNWLANNSVACGITLASHVAGHGVFHNVVTDNTIQGEKAAAGIMVATPIKGGMVYGNVISHNVVEDNGLGGIDLHTHVPGSNVNDNIVAYNLVSGNAPDFGYTTKPTGIDIGADGSAITGTVVAHNTVSHEYYGINLTALASTTITSGNQISATVSINLPQTTVTVK